MILNNKQLDILWDEYSIGVNDNNYKSGTLYLIFEHICNNLINIKKLYYHSNDVREDMVLTAIIKVYKNIYKYDQNRMMQGQAKNNREVNVKRGLYSFIELIMIRSFYSTLAKHSNNKIVEVSLDDGYNQKYQKSKDPIDFKRFELAVIETESIDDKIDEEARLKRAAEFEKRLDKLEKGRKCKK